MKLPRQKNKDILSKYEVLLFLFHQSFYCSFLDLVTVVLTGYPQSGSGRMEVIKEDFKTEVCNNMPKYPLEVSGAAGSMWKCEKLTVCGGSECYSLENGNWTLNSNKLKTGRNGHGASNIGNDEIFITGGYNEYDLDDYDDDEVFASTEIIHSDGKITQGPNLPKARDYHCQISHEQNTFIIGKNMLCYKKYAYSKAFCSTAPLKHKV